MRIEHLQYLVELYKIGSISKAAEALYISQQGLSQSIQSLEKHLGVSILNRTCNKVSFTETGKKIVNQAEEILFKIDELYAIVDPQKVNLKATKGVALTLFATPFFSTSFLPKLLHQFHLKYPNIELLVLEKKPSQLIHDICTDPNVLGLLNVPDYEFDPKIFDDNNLTFNILKEGEYTVLVDENSPWADRAFISIDEISKSNFAVLDFEQMNNVYEYLFKMMKNKPNIVLRTVNQELYTSTISSGLAIGLSTSVSKAFGKTGALAAVRVKPSIKLFIGCVSYAKSQNPNIQLFSHFMAKFFNSPYF
jgi:Transcriptional regulator